MIKKILLSVFAVFALFMAPNYALAATNPIKDVCNTGNGQAVNSSICKQAKGIDGNSSNPVATTLHTAANIIALVTAVIAVIMMVIAGLTLVTSRGDSTAVTTSRNRIIYAVVGLLIISAAWTITTLLVDKLT